MLPFISSINSIHTWVLGFSLSQRLEEDNCKGPVSEKNTLGFTSVSPGTRIPLRQLTTQQKEVLRKSEKQWHKQCTSLCLHLGTCVSRPCLHWSLPGSGPSKENIEHLHTIVAFSLPFFALFLFLSSPFPFGSFLVESLLERQWPQIPGGKKQNENPHRSAWSLIFDGQFPHEFPIAFYGGLVMCRT